MRMELREAGPHEIWERGKNSFQVDGIIILWN